MWAPSPDPLPYVDLADETAPLRFPGSERIDLRSENGLRIWVRTGTDRTEMRFQFHHSCSDGTGAHRFIEDLLCAYDMAVRPHSHQAAFRPLDPALLRTRTRFGLSWPKLLRRTPQEAWGIFVGLPRFFLRRSVPLCSPEQPVLDEANRLTLLDYPAHTYDKAETKRLRAVAFSAGTFINDLLLRDLLLAMHDWNLRHGEKTGRRYFRIMIPMDLRGPEDEAMPAANVVGMVFLDRRPHHYGDPRRLLVSIKRKTSFFQSWRLGLAWIRGCSIVDAIPGGMAFCEKIDRCYATTALSNVGRVLSRARLARREGKVVAGDLTLEGVESAPPVRPHSGASFTCLSYAGRLTLVMNYDRHHFTAEGARALLETVVRQTRQSARSSPEPPPALSDPSGQAVTAETPQAGEV